MKNINKYVLFVMSYLLNAFGSALMVKGSIGSIVWTVTAENLGAFIGISVGLATTIISIIFYIISKIIGKDFNIKDTSICVLLTLMFGVLIDFFIIIIGPEQSNYMAINYVCGFIGIIIVCMSSSLAIEANVAYLAFDDFNKNMKNHIFKGNIALAITASVIIGFVLALVFGLLNNQIVNVSLVTFTSFGLGFIVRFFDQTFGFTTREYKVKS